jgi:hypothetical protein
LGLLIGDVGPDGLNRGDRTDVLRARDGANGNDEAFVGPSKDTIFADPGDRTRY